MFIDAESERLQRRLEASEAESRRLRALLDEAAAFWRPVARDLEHNKLSLNSVRFLAQDFLTMLARETGAMPPD